MYLYCTKRIQTNFVGFCFWGGGDLLLSVPFFFSGVFNFPFFRFVLPIGFLCLFRSFYPLIFFILLWFCLSFSLIRRPGLCFPPSSFSLTESARDAGSTSTYKGNECNATPVKHGNAKGPIYFPFLPLFRYERNFTEVMWRRRGQTRHYPVQNTP